MGKHVKINLDMEVMDKQMHRVALDAAVNDLEKIKMSADRVISFIRGGSLHGKNDNEKK